MGKCSYHIKFSSRPLTPRDLTKHFEGLRVRIYGDVGIVNVLVVATNKNGNIAGKTVFTGVFIYRDGRKLSRHKKTRCNHRSIDLVSALPFTLCSRK
jgi:hypothetical protein